MNPPAPAAAWSMPWSQAHAAIARGAVVVVVLDLDRPARQPAWAELLDDAERARAARFASAELRTRFTAAHGQLRDLLAACSGRPAAALAFARGPHGKPALVDGGGLEFSLSHAGGLALCAPEELAALRRLPAAALPAAFLGCWTRKEALVKATGTGLFAPFAEFAVSVPPEPARLVRAPPQERAHAWSFALLPDLPGHALALVVEGTATAAVTCCAP